MSVGDYVSAVYGRRLYIQSKIWFHHRVICVHLHTKMNANVIVELCTTEGGGKYSHASSRLGHKLLINTSSKLMQIVYSLR